MWVVSRQGKPPPYIDWQRPDQCVIGNARLGIAPAQQSLEVAARAGTVSELATLATFMKPSFRSMPAPELRKHWQKLLETPSHRYDHRFLESQLAYRIQARTYGGLKPATSARLEALGKQPDGGNISIRHQSADDRLRVQGLAHVVQDLAGIDGTV